MEFPTYQLSSTAALEVFEDGALILNLKDVTFTELNPTARDVLYATDGQADLRQVAQILAQEYEINLPEALADVSELYQQLAEQGILELVQTPDQHEA